MTSAIRHHQLRSGKRKKLTEQPPSRGELAGYENPMDFTWFVCLRFQGGRAETLCFFPLDLAGNRQPLYQVRLPVHFFKS